MSIKTRPTRTRTRTETTCLSRTANAAAKSIVRHVEEETGKSLSLQTCLNLVQVIQTCMDEAVSEARVLQSLYV